MQHQVMVIGGGGREHALAWRLAASERVSRVFVAPGNAGTEGEDKCVNIGLASHKELADFHEAEKLAFTVVGPEAPLAEGLVDHFRDRGLRVFGPEQAAARLESSKCFAKEFMDRHGIPTAAWGRFDDAGAAHAWIDGHGGALVVKADGLAAGKGVIVCDDPAGAHAAVDQLLAGVAGGSGARLVIEERLEGEEASFIVMVDGHHVLPLATSQDHKRLLDGDAGPNTGGMGAYSPAPVISPERHARAMREVIQPVVRGMAAEGTPYVGFLYAGLMIQPDGSLKVLEFNCRLGDPEAQPILMRLRTDLFGLIEAALDGRLDEAEADWDRRVALSVVLASPGYPVSPRLGEVISGAGEDFGEGIKVFHAGTRQVDGQLLTAGGRVLAVTGLGDTLALARRHTYEAVEQVRFPERQLRRDIGHRGL